MLHFLKVFHNGLRGPAKPDPELMKRPLHKLEEVQGEIEVTESWSERMTTAYRKWVQLGELNPDAQRAFEMGWVAKAQDAKQLERALEKAARPGGLLADRKGRVRVPLNVPSC